MWSEIYRRDGIAYAVAHPCHPSVFLERTTKEEHADTFGGIGARGEKNMTKAEPALRSPTSISPGRRK